MLDVIKAICRRHYYTGKYGGAHFRLNQETFEQLKTAMGPSEPLPSDPYKSSLTSWESRIMDIPIIIDAALAGYKWRLVDNITKEILFEGELTWQ